MTPLIIIFALLAIAGAGAWFWIRQNRGIKLAEQRATEESERLATTRRDHEKAIAEAKAGGDARLQAEAEERSRKEAKARENAWLAEEQRLATEKCVAEAEAKLQAEEQALAEVQAREAAHLKAEAEAEQRVETEARDRARLAAEEKQRAEECRQAEEIARAETEALERARSAAEVEALRLAEEKAKTEQATSQPAEETETEIVPQSKSRDYRPLAPVAPTASPRPKRITTNRQQRNVPLELRLQLDFDRDGGVKTLALVPERREGMPSQIEIGEWRFCEWNEKHYDPVPVESISDCLRQNIEWRSRGGSRSWCWILSRRDLHVLASGDVSGLYQFSSVPCLVINANHAVLTAVSLRGGVEAALNAAGCSNFTGLDEATFGVPTGWLLFRDVKPTRAVRRRDEIHILNALCPLRDIEPHYVGGIRLKRQTWLAGFPPRIRFTGELGEDFRVMIDAQTAHRATDDAFEAPEWDVARAHDLCFEDRRETYELKTMDENWEQWHAHDFGTGAAICGSSIHHVAGARWQQVRVPVRNPLLVGACPGELFFCVMRGDARCEFLTVLVPFNPVWALPPDSAFADKQTSRIVLLNSAEPIAPVELRNANAASSYSLRAWISAIRRAGCKQLALATESGDAKNLWRRYRVVAKQLWRKTR